MKRLENDFRLVELLEKCETVFRCKLPAGFLPERTVDQAIEIEDAAKPPYRALLKLLPA